MSTHGERTTIESQERIRELEKACMDSAMAMTLARLDARTAWGYCDMWRKGAQVEADLRGWLRLCEDNPEGHAEFYQWASHLYFGTPPPEGAEE